jgi:nucleotide-binding universal stress UspA family protein
MKNVLVPTDFSPEAHHAFEVALRLAQRTGGTVTLLHALEEHEGSDISTSGGRVGGDSHDEIFMLKLLEVTKRRLNSLISEGARIAPGVPVHEAMQLDSIDSAILKAIDHWKIDLVVMGAQEHSALEHFFNGSKTERVIRLAPCPVMAVKHSHPEFDAQHIVFPSDFKEEADLAAEGLRRVLAVFPNATVHLLHIVHDPAEHAPAMARIRDFAQRHRLDRCVPVVYEAANASAGIQRFTKETATDLVVLPNHGRTGFRRLLGTHTAEEVATHAFPPVLTYHLQN